MVRVCSATDHSSTPPRAHAPGVGVTLLDFPAYADRVPTRNGSAGTAVITTARRSRSADRRNRMRNYLLAMALRVICFILMIIIDDTVTRIVLIAIAGFVPGMAVLAANAVDRRRQATAPVEQGFPQERPALTDHRTITVDD